MSSNTKAWMGLTLGAVVATASVGLAVRGAWAQTTQPVPASRQPSVPVAPGALSTSPTAPVADPQAPATDGSEYANARIKIEKDLVDFGTVFGDRAGEKLEDVVIVTNVGTDPLHINDVTQTCGCTKPVMEKRILAPGESARLRVGFDPAGRKGDQKGKSVTLRTNDRQTPNVTITLKVFVRQQVWAEPSFVNLVSVTAGTSETFTLKVRGVNPDFDATRVTMEKFEYFRVRKVGTERLIFWLDPQVGDYVPAATLDGVALPVDPTRPAPVPVEGNEGAAAVQRPEKWAANGVDMIEVSETTYEVTFTGPMKTGRMQESLRIRTNQPAPNDSVQVVVAANVVGRVEASPQILTFGALRVGDSFERTFRLRSRTGDEFKINSFAPSITAHGIEATWKAVGATGAFGAKEYEVTLSGRIDESGVRLRCEAVFGISTPMGDEELRVPVSGVVPGSGLNGAAGGVGGQLIQEIEATPRSGGR